MSIKIKIKKILVRIMEQSPLFSESLDKIVGLITPKLNKNRRLLKEIQKFTSHKYNPEKCLRDFLNNIKNVPYYKKQFQKYQINIHAVDIYKEIQKIPILTRDEIINHYNEFLNKDYKGKTMTIGSSGTTATSLVFPCQKDRSIKSLAVWWRYRINLGIKFGTWCGLFGGNVIVPIEQKEGPYYIIDLIGRQIIFSAFHLTINTVEEYYFELQRKKLIWLHGHGHNLTLLANLIQQKGLTPLNGIRYITTGADNLFEWQRKLIIESFPNALVRQHYGLTEGVANISEDKDGKLKVDEDYAYVEFIPLDKSNSELCRIVGTAFNNAAFPMVRYDTGDLATIHNKPNGEIEIVQIDGRTIDCIKLPNGRRISATSMTNFEYTTKVKEVQYYQKDFNNILVRIVPREGYDTAEEIKVLESIRHRVPNEVRIEIEYVEKIERTKNGKIRYIISEV